MAISVIPVFGMDPRARTRLLSHLARTWQSPIAPIGFGDGGDPIATIDRIIGDIDSERVLLSCHESTLATEVIGALSHLACDVPAVVGVIPSGWAEILTGDGEYIRQTAEGSFAVPAPVLLGSQLEYCTTLITDAPAGGGWEAIEEFRRAAAGPVGSSLLVRERAGDPLLSALNPRAQICGWPAMIEPRERVEETVPGWLSLACPDLVGPGEAEPVYPGVVTHRYDRVFPFHRGRLLHLLENSWWTGVVRMAGFVRLGGSSVIHLWEQWGHTVSLDPYEAEWWVDPASLESGESIERGTGDLGIGQRLAIIGRDVDVAGIERELDRCLITDEEFILGRWE